MFHNVFTKMCFCLVIAELGHVSRGAGRAWNVLLIKITRHCLHGNPLHEIEQVEDFLPYGKGLYTRKMFQIAAEVLQLVSN